MLDATFLLQTLVSGIGTGCIYGLIGIGFCVIYNASGIVNFAQGVFVMLGGMIAHALLTRAGLPFPLAALLAVVIVAGLGIVIERLVVQPLWRRNATMFVMILATLAAQIVIERLTLMVAGDQPRTLPGISDAPPFKIGGVAFSVQLLWIAGLSLLLVGGLALFFARTRVGKAMRACAINRGSGRPAGHSGLAHAQSCVRAVGRARRGGRHPDHADAIHRVQRRRAVCHQRLHRCDSWRLWLGHGGVCRRHHAWHCPGTGHCRIWSRFQERRSTFHIAGVFAGAPGRPVWQGALRREPNSLNSFIDLKGGIHESSSNRLEQA